MTKPLKNPRLIKIQSQANIMTQTCQTLCGWSLGDKWRHSGGPTGVPFAGLRSFCVLARSGGPARFSARYPNSTCLLWDASHQASIRVSRQDLSPPPTCLVSLPQTGTPKRFTWQNPSIPQIATILNQETERRPTSREREVIHPPCLVGF